eukprot:gene18355-24048_t
MANDQTGLAYAMVYVLTWELFRRTNLWLHYENSYWSERKGFFIQSIGVIESCFRQCVGTPRQGLLVPSSKATLILASNISPESLDGLEEFSHVWITFKFHLNTNTLKESKAFNINENNKDGRKYTFTAKIVPPMLKEKKGVFATRSPHRPNPIGVTLAKIDKVDKLNHCLRLSACDLVDGTPVLDIKPYVPSYDSSNDYKIPQWIEETIDTRNAVTFLPSIINDVTKLQKKLKQFKNNIDGYMNALRETLEVDVRSKFQTRRRIEDATKVQTIDPGTGRVVVMAPDVGLREFTFDGVFGSSTSQKNVYNTTMKKLIVDLINGFNVTALVYGQTGSGKTFTMFGSDPNSYVNRQTNKSSNCIQSGDGIIPRQPCGHSKVSSQRYVLQGAAERIITNLSDIFTALNEGESVKRTAATAMNDRSTRAHSLVILSITQTNMATNVKRCSKLFLADLGGSEQVKKSQVEAGKSGRTNQALGFELGDHMREAIYINLGLGGNSRTSMIICNRMEGIHINETMTTLRFGAENERKLLEQLLVQREQLVGNYVPTNAKSNVIGFGKELAELYNIVDELPTTVKHNWIIDINNKETLELKAKTVKRNKLRYAGLAI